MCGVVACLAWGAPVDDAAVARARAALGHRGPDGAGTWRAAGGHVALAHARLAVIDRATGAQPLASEDGAVVAVVNGELYGFEAQRDALAARGHALRSRGDSEVLVHLYEEHGAGCVDHLRGEFAFALWDARAGALVAARDRFGVRPLLYAVHAGALWLASEAKALFAAGVPAAWDDASVFQSASLQYALPDRTLFRGVRQVPPGHLLRATRDGAVTVARYWDLDYPPEAARRPLDARGAGELAARVRAALDDAVRVRLRADARVCFQLSGGLDSSAVVGLAARRAAAPLDCFTVGFEGEGYDELPLAEETARRAGARLHPVRVGQDAMADDFAAAVAHGEGLAINGHVAAKYALARAVRAAGFAVVLTGEGADEVFAGYAHLRRDLALAEGGDPATLAALAARNVASAGTMLPEGDALPLDAARRALGFVPTWLEAKATLGRRVRALLADDFAARFAGHDPVEALLASVDVEGQLRGRHPVEQSQYLWSKFALAGYILKTLGDGMELAHAIEGRLPFLDDAVFAAAREAPVGLAIRGGAEKALLREATRDVLTDAVRAREKHPFLAPPFGAPGTRAEALVHDTLRGGALPPFLDARRVRALLDALPALPPRERVAADAVVVMALSATILHHRYVATR